MAGISSINPIIYFIRIQRLREYVYWNARSAIQMIGGLRPRTDVESKNCGNPRTSCVESKCGIQELAIQPRFSFLHRQMGVQINREKPTNRYVFHFLELNLCRTRK